jgi:D-galactarolactone cycloisomerase
VKIDRVETYPLLFPLATPYGDANGYKKYRSSFLVRIITQSGIDGWGECTDWLPALQIGFTERITPFLIGRFALDRTKTVHIINKWHQRAGAAVSMALTEIAAKFSKMHICELWGGRWRSVVPVYASCQSYIDHPEWKQHSCSLVDQVVGNGFKQIKIKIGGRSIREDQQHICMVQKEFQDSVQIILDANQSYDSAAAIEWYHILNRWNNFLWLEEPIPFHSAKEYAYLRARIPIALAGGENMTEAAKFLPLLHQSALDIIQPDPQHHASIDTYRETLTLGRQYGVRISPHCYDGNLSRMYALFAQACLPPWNKMGTDFDIEPVEWDVMENPFNDLVVMNPLNGKVPIPHGIGTGLELDMELIKAHLWDGRSYEG